MSIKSKIAISVAYAERDQQWIREFSVDRGCSAEEALVASGLLEAVPQLGARPIEDLSLGVYSQTVERDYLMEEGDRLEIYRPLTADPKEVRRQLAALGKTMGRKRS